MLIDEGDHWSSGLETWFVFLKVSPMRGVTHFGIKGKLAPWFTGPFEIIERVGPLAYHLDLPPHLSDIHNVFHVSMLRKYEPDSSQVVMWIEILLWEDLTYKEEQIMILDREVKVLRCREIPLVKVLWQYKRVEEATWDLEFEIREKYPFLFWVLLLSNFGDEIF